MSRDIILPGGDTLKLFDSAYTASEVEAILTKALRQPGDNLLRNARWDVLANIVNQRGQLEYTTGYGIDGWINSASGTVTIESDGLVLSSGVMLDQRLPKTVFALDGQYTLSILTADGKLGTITKPVGENEWGALQTGINGVFARMTKTGNDYYDVASISASSACKLVAAYLEWGDHQTAFRKDANGNWVLNGPPQDFGLELAKCQYFYRPIKLDSRLTLRSNGAYALSVPFSTMRTIPTYTFNASEGVTVSNISRDCINFTAPASATDPWVSTVTLNCEL